MGNKARNKVRNGRPANCTPQELRKFTCSLGQEGASSGECYLGTAVSVPSNRTATAAGSSTPASGTAPSPGSQSSGMCGTGTVSLGGDSQTSSVPVSPASPTPSPASG